MTTHLAFSPKVGCPAGPIESPERFIAAMARAATGVCVITTDGEAGEFALTVSAISSVSAEPPLMLACINRRSPVAAAIERNGLMAVNVLADTQQHVADVFAGRSPGANYDFNCAKWYRATTGSPLLAGAAAVFDCEVDAIHEAGTHRIVMGRVVEAGYGEALPLVYAQRAYRTLANIDVQERVAR
jgi:flavin reductase